MAERVGERTGGKTGAKEPPNVITLTLGRIINPVTGPKKSNMFLAPKT
jgi:hypothetical protein